MRTRFLVFIAAALTGGPALPGAETVLVQFDTPMKFLVPPAASGLGWTAADFDDAGWTPGAFAVGYKTGTPLGMLRTQVAAATQAVYTRTRFAIADLAEVESVWLGVDYDDGYVAWVNGREVARSLNLPVQPDFNTAASSDHDPSGAAVPDYEPIRDITAAARPVLVAGENVLAIGVWNKVLPSSDLALAPYFSINRVPPPPVEVHWTLAGSPYQVASTLTIPRGTVLRIDPGVEVRLSPGVEIAVAGQVLAQGTPEARITFDRLGDTGSWGGIDIDHGQDGVPRPSTLRNCVLRNGATLIDVEGTLDSEVVIEDCELDSWSTLALHWDDGANRLRISRCRIGMNTPVAEQDEESVNGYRSSAVLEHCIFGPRRGYTDTIDLADTKWGGPVPTVQYNVILPGEDDGIDLDDCDGYVIGNLIYGRRPLPTGPKEEGCPQYPIAGSGPNGGGITGNEGSRPVVMNNIVYDCFHGIGYKNAADPLIINNTVVGCTWGIVLFETSDISNPEVAHGTLVNNLIWDCQSPVRLRWCESGPLSSATVRNSVVPGGWPGTGNISPRESPLVAVADPLNPTRADFRLRACSPAIDAAYSGDVSRPYHVEPVPERDAEGGARMDIATVPDFGTGSPAFADIGALEFAGPDACVAGRFLRGDASGDGRILVSDAVQLLFVLFRGLSTDCEDALDSNDDGRLDTTDALLALRHLFLGGPAPAPPFPAPGTDPTGDGLGCRRS